MNRRIDTGTPLCTICIYDFWKKFSTKKRRSESDAEAFDELH
jgi:hypothetical protein